MPEKLTGVNASSLPLLDLGRKTRGIFASALAVLNLKFGLLFLIGLVIVKFQPKVNVPLSKSLG